MLDEDENGWVQFVTALKALNLAQRQLSVFREKSTSAIRDDRLKDAEYCIAWIERLEVDLPNLRNRLLLAFDALDDDFKSEVVTLLSNNSGPHLPKSKQ